MAGSVPGSPAAVLQAVLRQNPTVPYTSSQYRHATFTTDPNMPFLPSMMDEVVFLPQNAYLDANVATAGTVAAGGASTAAVGALTSGTTISVDASLGNTFTVTLTGSDMLANPVNPADGQRVIFAVTQDSSGSRTLSYDTAYEFSSALPAPTLSTTPGVTDYLGFVYSAAAAKWRFLAFVSGFS